MVKYLRLFLFLSLIGNLSPILLAQTASHGLFFRDDSASRAKKFDYLFYQGLVLKGQGKGASASDLFNQCYAMDSTSSVLLINMAQVATVAKQNEKALYYLYQAVKYAPDNANYRYALASMLERQELFSDAVEQYEKLLKIDPDNSENRFSLANLYVREGELGKAIDILDDLEREYGIIESISVNKMQLYIQMGDVDGAEKEVKGLIEKYPEEPKFYQLLGDFYLDQSKYDKALIAYNKILELDPKSKKYPAIMLHFYSAKGDKETARAFVKEIIGNKDLDPIYKSALVYSYIDELPENLKKGREVRELLDLMLQNHPGDPTFLSASVIWYMANKDYEKAREEVKRALEINPKNIGLWGLSIDIEVSVEDIPAALEISKSALNLFPEDSRFYLNLGIFLFHQNLLEEAVQTFQKGIERIEPKEPVVLSIFYGQLGDLYQELKQFDAVREVYEKALEYNPNNESVLNNYSYFLAVRGEDLKKAERMSALSIKLSPNNPTFLDTYAWVFFKQGNYTLAKLYIKSAFNSSEKEESADLHDHYGDILFMNGEEDEAVKEWEKALELGCKNVELPKKIKDRKYYEYKEKQ